MAETDQQGTSFDEETALSAVRLAASRAGIELPAPRLLRLGENAVFASGDLVVRVVRAASSREDVARSVEISRWLNGQGVPAVEALGIDQPIDAGGLLVTVWRSLGDGDNYGSTADLARLLKRLHALSPPPTLSLGDVDPFVRASRRLTDGFLPQRDREFLQRRLDDLRLRCKNLSFTLGAGVVHDDASVGNVLVDHHGVARFIDLDGMGIGHYEWDLILTAIYYDRFGWHTLHEYTDFCKIYGADVMKWDGYETLADLRELVMVTWMSQNIGRSKETATEFWKRLETLKSGTSRKGWAAF